MRFRKLLSGIIAGSLVFSMPVINFMQVHATTESTSELHAIPGEDISCNANSEHTGAEIEKAFDGDKNTFWDSAWWNGDKGLGVTPIIIDVEFDYPRDIEKFVYTPRQDGNPNGQILKYSMSAVTESGEEIQLVENGQWENNHSDKALNIDQEERLVSVKLTITEGSMQAETSPTAATAAEFTFYETIPEVQISQDSLALSVGNSKQLSIIEMSGTSVDWTSSDSDIAIVSENGTVTGISEGVATIVGTTNGGEEATCEVSVTGISAPQREGYELVFEDNFSGESLDSSKWNNWCVDLSESAPFRYGNTPDVVVHPDNAYVQDGTLRLLGSKEETTFNGLTSQYRSGMIQTRDKFEPLYGYMETMIKIPDVAGTNPAIWMMPQAGENSGEWLWGDKDNFGAEIDILERPHPDGSSTYSHLKDKYQITIHYDNYAFTNHNKFHTEAILSNPYKWHKFAMEWTPEYIKFIVDDEVKAIQDKDVPNMPEIFILSYGMGGWIGQIDDSGLPAEMEVDYVRWYQAE